MHNAFGALTSLANLQAIAAMQGAANLSSAGGIAALGGNVDFMNNVNRHANLGGLGGLGINTSEHFVIAHVMCVDVISNVLHYVICPGINKTTTDHALSARNRVDNCQMLRQCGDWCVHGLICLAVSRTVSYGVLEFEI